MVSPSASSRATVVVSQGQLQILQSSDSPDLDSDGDRTWSGYVGLHWSLGLRLGGGRS